MPRKSNTHSLHNSFARLGNGLIDAAIIAPLPVESDAESVADEIPHAKAESTKAKDDAADTKMKDDVDEPEEEENEDENEDEEEVEEFVALRT